MRRIALVVLLAARSADAAPAPFRPEPVAVVDLDFLHTGSITAQGWAVLLRSRDACRWAVARADARKLTCLQGRADPAGWLRDNSRARLTPGKPPFRLELSGCSLAEARTLAQALCSGALCAAEPRIPALRERELAVHGLWLAYLNRVRQPPNRMTPAQKKQIAAYYHEGQWCQSRSWDLAHQVGVLCVSGEVRPYPEKEKP